MVKTEVHRGSPCSPSAGRSEPVPCLNTGRLAAGGLPGHGIGSRLTGGDGRPLARRDGIPGLQLSLGCSVIGDLSDFEVVVLLPRSCWAATQGRRARTF